MFHALGLTIDSLGLPEQSVGVFQKALAVRQAALGPEHDDAIASQNSLGEAYLAAERDAEALELFAALLKICESKHGVDHENTLEAQANLGMALSTRMRETRPARYRCSSGRWRPGNQTSARTTTKR